MVVEHGSCWSHLHAGVPGDELGEEMLDFQQEAQKGDPVCANIGGFKSKTVGESQQADGNGD